jgi:hypothetical protein
MENDKSIDQLQDLSEEAIQAATRMTAHVCELEVEMMNIRTLIARAADVVVPADKEGLKRDMIGIWRATEESLSRALKALNGPNSQAAAI